MKNILVLLSLIYFISFSKETCDIFLDVQSEKDCFSASVSDKNNNCCYVQIGFKIGEIDQSLKFCNEYNKDFSANDIKTELQKYYQKGEIVEVVKC